jgi:hypothetical protein
VLSGSSLVGPLAAYSQDNAVYNSSAKATVHSTAFIDAFAFAEAHTLPDMCTTIYNILTPAPSSASVIDARGFSGSALSCPANTSPWIENNAYLNKPSTILLPAGTITAPIPWVLPADTKLIGVAKSSSSNYILDTTIKAGFSSGAVVQFCPSSSCQAISVEHLTINGNGQTVNGIENDNCGVQCTVDHVTMYQVLGTGLMISGVNATDSGPYSNITFDVGSYTGQSPQCAQIIHTSGTRGIHGISCIATPTATNGILLDASNNSIEDVRIVGFYNGIVVGKSATAQSNILLNIYGDTAGSLSPNNLIQIFPNTVSDLAIMAVANAAIPVGSTTTIQDLQTSTTLADPYVGMYMLGESGSNGNSRFTTSTTVGANAATWMFGAGAPSSTTCAMGSLYSDTTTGTGGGGLYVCTPSGNGYAWFPVL